MLILSEAFLVLQAIRKCASMRRCLQQHQQQSLGACKSSHCVADVGTSKSRSYYLTGAVVMSSFPGTSMGSRGSDPSSLSSSASKPGPMSAGAASVSMLGCCSAPCMSVSGHGQSSAQNRHLHNILRPYLVMHMGNIHSATRPDACSGVMRHCLTLVYPLAGQMYQS